jgi:hypothetical protein
MAPGQGWNVVQAHNTASVENAVEFGKSIHWMFNIQEMDSP